jgi:hypothetical protein
MDIYKLCKCLWAVATFLVIYGMYGTLAQGYPLSTKLIDLPADLGLALAISMGLNMIVVITLSLHSIGSDD